MISVWLPILVLLLFLVNSSAQSYNTFKAYDKSSNPPPQYARPLRKKTKHAISEYLTAQQQMMLAKRTGPDQPQDMWGPNWSGFSSSSSTSTVSKSVTTGITASSSTQTKVNGNLRGTKINAASGAQVAAMQ